MIETKNENVNVDVKTIVKEKSMRQKASDGEITWREYNQYCRSKRVFDKTLPKSMKDKYLDGEIDWKEYKAYCLTKPKEKTMSSKYKNCEITRIEYWDYLAQKHGFKNHFELEEYLVKRNGHKNKKDYHNNLAIKKGFNDQNERRREYRHSTDGSKSYIDNKKCTLHFGVCIAENVLSKVFKNVQRMPLNNRGYDFICAKGWKIEVKSSCTRINDPIYRNELWSFSIKKNTIADYFILLAFDNRKNQNPLRVWIIKGTEIVGLRNKKQLNTMTQFKIFNSKESIDYYKQYEHTDKLEKVKECCEELKNKKN